MFAKGALLHSSQVQDLAYQVFLLHVGRSESQRKNELPVGY